MGDSDPAGFSKQDLVSLAWSFVQGIGAAIAGFLSQGRLSTGVRLTFQVERDSESSDGVCTLAEQDGDEPEQPYEGIGPYACMSGGRQGSKFRGLLSGRTDHHFTTSLSSSQPQAYKTGEQME